MRIGIVRERMDGENRVAATPKTVEQLIKLGFEVTVETGAGNGASFFDNDYETAGAVIQSDGREVWQSDIVLKVNGPIQREDGELESAAMNPGATLVSLIWPAQNPALLEKLVEQKITVLSMDCVPRISRAQSLDALSSMANIAGYRAVVEAAHVFGRFFTGQITAAGKVPAAKVLVIGAGVAGLAAIGAAGSLGAIVRAFDTRPEVKEQITSMGADFLEVSIEEEGGSSDGYAREMSEAFIKAEMALFAAQAKEVDIIITTAAIPGKPAPKLITAEMVASMKPGSVIVDLASPTGGNCELTEPGDLITRHGVKIIGYTNFPSRLAAQSSQLYGTNLVNLMKLLCKNKDGRINVDFDDVVLRGMTVLKDGAVTWPAPPIQVSAQPKASTAGRAAVEKTEVKPVPRSKKMALILGAVLGFGLIANWSPPEFLSHFTVFVLACVVGYYVIWNVTHALHTPLMSVTNAISGIIIVGAVLQIGHGNALVTLLSFVAVLIASINIFGGFTVTRRMLEMFRRDK